MRLIDKDYVGYEICLFYHILQAFLLPLKSLQGKYFCYSWHVLCHSFLVHQCPEDNLCFSLACSLKASFRNDLHMMKRFPFQERLDFKLEDDEGHMMGDLGS